ncbi:MAG: S9 family peptidase, partial [Sphingopyxis sp.]
MTNNAPNAAPTPATTPAPATPPVAARIASRISHHGRTVEDDYAWLRDAGYPNISDPAILAHLHAENAWFDAAMAPQAERIETLFQEMKGRIKEDDSSVPQREGAFLYWREFAIGAQYRTWWRRPVDGGAAQCILDEPALAHGHDYFRLGALAVSPDGRLLAYATDTDGSERFTIYVRDLETGALLDDRIADMLSAIAWTGDSRGFLYGLANAQWRTDNARLHWIGTNPATDILLAQEDDEGFRMDVGVTQSERFLVITSGDHETSEIRLIPADAPLTAPLLVAPRKKGVEYAVEERAGTLFIHTNDNHPNFRLATATLDAPADWHALIAGSDDFYMTDVTTFADFYVVEGREAGLDQVEIRYYDDPSRVERIAFPESSYDAGLGENP